MDILFNFLYGKIEICNNYNVYYITLLLLQMAKITHNDINLNDYVIVNEKSFIKNNDDSHDTKHFRSPIIAIIGNADVGKSELFNKICMLETIKKDIGDNEFIGTKHISINMITNRTEIVDNQFKNKLQYKIPGVTIIDIPGNNIFNNLVDRAIGICDYVVLVIDIFIGIDPYTQKCIELLLNNNKKFIIVVNKVDLIYGWSTFDDNFKNILNKQTLSTKSEFNNKLGNIILQFSMLGLNANLYYDNNTLGDTYSIIPISTKDSTGIADLLMYMVQFPQKVLFDAIYVERSLNCVVMDNNFIDKLGVTVNVMIIDGILRKGDRIMLCSITGNVIITIIKNLIVSGITVESVENDFCCIVATGLDDVMINSKVCIIKDDYTKDKIENIKNNITKDYNNIMKHVESVGVYIVVKNMGVVETIVNFLKHLKVPIGGIRIGNLKRTDIMKIGAMRNYKYVLVNGIDVDNDIIELARVCNVTIFTNNILYALLDNFGNFISDLNIANDKMLKDSVLYPCVLSIVKYKVFNKYNPFIVGVNVIDGVLKKGTPICVMDTGKLVGIVKNIRKDDVDVTECFRGDVVCVNIDTDSGEVFYNKQFSDDALLCSKLTRSSIDALKTVDVNYVSVSNNFKLIKKIKNSLNII